MASTITQPLPNWDGLGWIGPQEKQPTSAQHMWELLQDSWKSIPGEASWENAKSVQSGQRQKGGYFEKSKIYFDLFNTYGYYMIPYVLLHSFDVFTTILKRRN